MMRFVPAILVALLGYSSLLPAQTSQCLFYDLNEDTLIDNTDTERFLACLTGPSLGPPGLECEGLDSDNDGDIDQDDFASFQVCFGRAAIPVPPVISEFMASNQTGLRDDFNEQSDWIEIHNPGAIPVRLNGWCLTDEKDRPDKWRFPEVVLPPGGYLIVFASNRNLTDPTQALHTNFKLEANGEYLALMTPDLAISQAFMPKYLPQVSDVSYGLGMTAPTATLVAPGADCRALIPSQDIGLAWTNSPFTETGWITGKTAVGYERSPNDAINYTNLIQTNVSAMFGVRRTVYVRIPFLVDDPGLYDRLTLRMKYDDGFVAYLNGQKVAWANEPPTLDWQSGASRDHVDSASIVYEDFDLRDFVGVLRPGSNVLAIHGLNNGATSSDLLVLPELVASGPGELIQPVFERYFLTPTPGLPNGGGVAGLGPLMKNPVHQPAEPGDPDDLVVTVEVLETFHPVASVSLQYRVMYGPISWLTMHDDGAHGDGAAGDGTYGVVIPASVSYPGQMIRYAFTATDTLGNSLRWPLFADPDNSPEYFGTVVADPTVTSNMPVLQWFVENVAAVDTTNRTGTRCSLFYNGEFYDNVYCRIRGHTSASLADASNKFHFKFDFNSGNHFRFHPDEGRVEELNLNSTFSDKAYIRQVLAAETYRDAGCPYSMTFPVRVQRNNAFYSVAVFLEQPDEDYLERNDLDPYGALYKMFTQLESTSGCEKQTRRHENFSDLQALVNGVSPSRTLAERRQYLFDHVDIPACINYLAATTIMHDNDHMAKNYYTYRDTEDTGEWMFLPWDKDLTFGRNFGAGGGVLSDGMWAANDPYSHPLFGDSDHPKVDGPWNRLIDALNDTPEIRQMHMRRLRTLMDELLQPPGTPAVQLRFESRIDELVAQMQPEMDQDYAKWGTIYGQAQTPTQAINILKTQYLAPRRTHLYNTHGPIGSGLIPAAQPANAPIQFGAVEHSPPSGIQDEEYIELVNANTYAVDISGWTLEVNGRKKHRFHPGTVLRAQSSLYATPRASAFRARATSPKGGESLFVQGNYDNHIVPGEVLVLRNTADQVVAQVTVTP